MFVGDNIQQQRSNWSFDGKTAEDFYKHAQKSIINYEESHEIICKLSEFFCKNGSTCYDLGTSTGELLIDLAHYNQYKDIEWVGLDKVENMVKKALSNYDELNEDLNIKYEVADIEKYDYKKSDFFILSYTLQFIPYEKRSILLDKIYNSLNYGGAVVVFEKVISDNAFFQDIFRSIYTDFKLKSGLTSEEIINKEQSIRSVLVPNTSENNIQLLKDAGFKNVSLIMKYCCFEGYVAVK